MPEWVGALIAFVYGAAVGSFLNVCIFRLPNDESIIQPPSHCPKCNTRLKWSDLVPLFSFLFLRGKCRYCGEPISWRYFAVESATGLLFSAIWLRYGLSIDFFIFAAFSAALVVAFVTDLEHFIIPDQVSVAGIVLGIARDAAHWAAGDLKPFTVSFFGGDRSFPVPPSIAGILVCGGIFYLIAFLGYFAFMPRDPADRENYEGALGGGDIKLAAAVGSVLGVGPALGSFFIAVILGTLIGCTVAGVRSLRSRKELPWRTEIPFGPYMVVGALAVILLRPELGRLWAAWVKFVVH
ncbi:MAG: prepilin peptidase [Armatimonadota bacterium]|nr:prepilin peptidase [Armatimonadota bacterium]